MSFTECPRLRSKRLRIKTITHSIVTELEYANETVVVVCSKPGDVYVYDLTLLRVTRHVRHAAGYGRCIPPDTAVDVVLGLTVGRRCCDLQHSMCV